jgi:hypothetical protein
VQPKPVCDPELEISRTLPFLKSPETEDFLNQASGDDFLSQIHPFVTQVPEEESNIQRFVVAEDGQPPTRM